jgi:hypothetical protein
MMYNRLQMDYRIVDEEWYLDAKAALAALPMLHAKLDVAEEELAELRATNRLRDLYDVSATWLRQLEFDFDYPPTENLGGE